MADYKIKLLKKRKSQHETDVVASKRLSLRLNNNTHNVSLLGFDAMQCSTKFSEETSVAIFQVKKD